MEGYASHSRYGNKFRSDPLWLFCDSTTFRLVVNRATLLQSTLPSYVVRYLFLGYPSSICNGKIPVHQDQPYWLALRCIRPLCLGAFEATTYAIGQLSFVGELSVYELYSAHMPKVSRSAVMTLAEHISSPYDPFAWMVDCPPRHGR
jgi:hypothetical protein